MNAMATQGGAFAALAVTLLAFLIGGGIGWLLKRIVTPKRKSATANELGRTWAGWIIFFTSAQLGYFVGKLDVLSFLSWLVGGGICILLAYIAGWAYGHFLKFRTSNSGLDRASDAIYVQIDQELRTNNLDRAIWTRALGDGEGSEERAKALYIKYRAQRLTASPDKSGHSLAIDAASADKPTKGRSFAFMATTTAVPFVVVAASVVYGMVWFLTEKQVPAKPDFSTQADTLALEPWEMDWSKPTPLTKSVDAVPRTWDEVMAEERSIGSAAEQRLRRADAAISIRYPDWREITGSLHGTPTAYRTWLATQSAEYQAKINSTWDANEIVGSIDKFRAATK
jgi:hypothetical protein